MKMLGKIMFWNFERGFGFIQTPAGKDYFAHIKQWFDDAPPAVGRIVEFEVGPGASAGKKEQAVSIRFKFDAAKVLAGGIQ